MNNNISNTTIPAPPKESKLITLSPRFPVSLITLQHIPCTRWVEPSHFKGVLAVEQLEQRLAVAAGYPPHGVPLVQAANPELLLEKEMKKEPLELQLYAGSLRATEFCFSVCKWLVPVVDHNGQRGSDHYDCSLFWRSGCLILTQSPAERGGV